MKKLLCLVAVFILAAPLFAYAGGGNKSTVTYAAYGDIKDWDPLQDFGDPQSFSALTYSFSFSVSFQLFTFVRLKESEQ